MSDHELLSRLFLQACELAPETRTAFLDDACKGNPVLRQELEAMLRADGAAAAGGTTERIAADLHRVAGEFVSRVHTTAPDHIGPYTILETLGEGGMGIVYRAEQTEPIRREVALKILRGGLDSAVFLARFEAERRTLAAMEHPNVARVLEAGADEDGRPFLAMELVQGVPITDYVRSADPSLRDRIRLHLDVCRGVSHAHQRGVIHRDLKPSNILVTLVHGHAVPKVIDFSIAKALEEPLMHTAFRTRTGQIIGTLEYMSPEQATGRVDAVDTRSDVYALGVLLYEMVAGELPHDVAGQPLHEAVRRIVEEPPRTLRGGGDLETIIAKCLEKDPERRYSGAPQLAEDLQRYLESRPILARPPSTTYQFRKLIGRHRLASAVIALSFLFLLTLAVVMKFELREQNRERVRAEEQAHKAEKVTEFMQQVYRSASQELGHDATIREALSMAAKQIEDEKSGEPLARAAVLQAIGDSYGNFNEFEEGLVFLKEARGILEQHLDPGDQEIAEVYWDIAVNRYRAQKFLAGESALRLALPIHERHAAEKPGRVADDLGLLALFLFHRGATDEAEGLLRREIAIYEQMSPGTDENWDAMTTAQENLANALQRRGRVGESEAIVREVLRTRESKGASTGMNRFNLAFLLQRQGKCEEAEELYQSVIDGTRQAQGDRHPIVARALERKGTCLIDRGRYQEGEAAIRASLQLALEGVGPESMDYAGALRALGRLLGKTDQFEEAEQRLQDAIRIHGKVFGEESVAVAVDWSDLGEVQEAEGRWAQAEESFRLAVAMMERKMGPESVELAYRLGALTDFLCRRGRFEEAAPLQARALQILRTQSDEGSPELAAAKERQAWVLDGLGRFTEAEEYRAEALAWDRRVLGDENPRVATQLFRRAAALHRQGRQEEALPLLREAAAMQRRFLGERAPEVAAILLETAEVLESMGEVDAARSSARQALGSWEGHPFVDPALLARARTLASSS